MDVSAIMAIAVAKFPILGLILGVLGCLLVAGQAIVVLTPSKTDDAAWAKILAIPVLGQVLSALVEFAPVQKK